MYSIPLNAMNSAVRDRIRDRPFNLKGGLWFFVSFRIFFRTKKKVRIFFFCRTNFFFQNLTLGYMTKSDYFFQQHWESEYFFRKKT
jgi:hypothetical protein